jgi:serine/threonine protein kinase
LPLTAGDKLGPYEILALIGKGGMGEVYRAHDPRTGRDVAVKVSAERFNERFDREVRAVAALNHLNICHLYVVGPDYLVMELVEGRRWPTSFVRARFRWRRRSGSPRKSPPRWKPRMKKRLRIAI